MAPKAKPGAMNGLDLYCLCGFVLLLVILVILTILLLRTIQDLRANPPTKGQPHAPRVAPGTGTGTGTGAGAVAGTAAAGAARGKDVTDYPVIDRADRAGPARLQPEPPVYPSQDPYYPRRGHPGSFQQLGILSAMNEKTDEPIILPIFGRKIGTGGADRWNYYAATDKNTLWKIPITQKGRDCTDRYNGCPEIYDGDTVFVPSYQREFVVSLYPYRGPVF